MRRGRHRAHRHSQVDVYDLLVGNAYSWHSSPRYPVRFRSWMAAESILQRPSRQVSGRERVELDVEYAAQMTALGFGGAR